MRKLIKPSLIALALSGVSTIALAQATTGTETTAPAAKSPTEQSDSMKTPTETNDAMRNQSTTGSSATNSSATSPSSSASATSNVQMIPVADAEKWVGKRVYSADGSDIGEVAAFKDDGSGNVDYFRTDIGGFLGIGETHVQVKPAQFSMRDDKLYLNMTKKEAMELPRAEKSAQ